MARQLEINGLAGGLGDSRGTLIESVLITNADLDHVLGLFQLREDRLLKVVCATPVRQAISEELRLDSLLANYCGIQFIEPAFTPQPLYDWSGQETGLLLRAIPADGSPPKFSNRNKSPHGLDSVGYEVTDQYSLAKVVVFPDVQEWSHKIESACVSASLILFDGTFWDEDELARVRPGARTATQMGHIPISGPDGSLAHFSRIGAKKMVYVHINNTNPILLKNSIERNTVEACSMVVGEDGMRWNL